MYVFWGIFVVTIVYLVVRSRMIDFFSLATVCFYLYHMPYLFGSFEYELLYLNHTSIGGLAYFYVSMIASVLFLAMVFFDFNIRGKVRVAKPLAPVDLVQIRCVLGIAIVLFLYALYTEGVSSLVNSKRGGGVMGPLFGMSTWAFLIGLSLGLVNRHRLTICICLFCLLLSMLMTGSRSYFVVALVMCVLFFSAKNGEVVVVKNLRIVFLGGLVLGVTLLYKPLYRSIQDLDYSAVGALLSDSETYKGAFSFGESYVVASHFQQAIDSDLSLGGAFIIHRLLSIFPVIPSLFESLTASDYPRYSSIILSDYYNSSFGLASNIWAEGYALGGGLALCFILVAWIFVIYKSSVCWVLGYRSGVFPYLIPFIVYLSFYMHRLDITFVLGAFKVCVFFYIFSYLVRLAIPRKRLGK